jgi:DNA helicase II / ATP-dependent DNA helicase PcrA
VGVTRAEELLFLSHARSRYRFGEQQQGIRSRFIDEIDAENVVFTEAGRPFVGKKDRFELRGSGSPSFDDVDPHYYRRNLREEPQPPRPKPLPTKGNGDRRVVYEEGEAEIVPGVMVTHSAFGEGKVIAVEGHGERAAATVFFPDVGQKKLRLRFARLQVVG